MADRLVSALSKQFMVFCALLTLMVCCADAGAVLAPDLQNGQEFLALVAADEDQGRISREESLLLRFQYGFAPDELPERYSVATFSPLRCGTTLIHEFYAGRSRLSPRTVQQIETWLQSSPAAGNKKFAFISPSGRFSFTYETSGTNSVPTADTDPANGVPDYVDRAAQYFDSAWNLVVDVAGFTAPPLRTGTYHVSFESMQFYGYTSILSVLNGESRIVMHNSFVGFPSNDDPEGGVAGSAKVTAAHEFKHASQFAATRWAEGGWIELDATWAEELVFDEVNDYYNRLSGESPVKRPDIPLDGGANRTGSYEDCIWQQWLSESFGVATVYEFWQRRVHSPTESVMDSYGVVLSDHGVAMENGWAAFTAWNYAVAERAIVGLGYDEAAAYPSGPLHDQTSTYPYSVSGSVEHLAASFVRLEGFSESSDEIVRVIFEGQTGADELSLSIVIEKRDGSGVLEIVALDGSNGSSHTLSTLAGDISSVGLVVGNAATSGLAAGWNLAVELEPVAVFSELVLDHASVRTVVFGGKAGQTVVRVGNAGEAGSLLNFTTQLWTNDPADLSIVTKDMTGSSVTVAESKYLPGEVLNLNLTVTNASGDDEWLSDVSLDFPLGVSVVESSAFVGGTLGSLDSDNNTGDGALVLWHGTFGSQGYGVLRDGESAVCTVQIAVDSDFGGDLVLPWSLSGDGFGSAPHQVDGQLSLVESNPTLALLVPRGGETIAVSDTVSISWTTHGVVPVVDLELSRDNGATWQSLASGIANVGSFRTAITGPASNTCLVRVGTLDMAISSQSETTFYIYESPTWLSVLTKSGALLAAESIDLELIFSAVGSELGSHDAWLVIHHDGLTLRTVVPVTMAVELEDDDASPRRPLILHGVFPNPFNPRTTVSFELNTPAETSVDVLDVRGRVVRQLFQGKLTVGDQTRVWDGHDNRGRGMSAGVYFIRVQAGAEVSTAKVVLTK
ncbi:MAG: hypothetical protein ACI9UK_000109 [Candidatus Krumholzibacteriia bacterium]|jgi:hypothetical protein